MYAGHIFLNPYPKSECKREASKKHVGHLYHATVALQMQAQEWPKQRIYTRLAQESFKLHSRESENPNDNQVSLTAAANFFWSLPIPHDQWHLSQQSRPWATILRLFFSQSSWPHFNHHWWQELANKGMIHDEYLIVIMQSQWILASCQRGLYAQLSAWWLGWVRT